MTGDDVKLQRLEAVRAATGLSKSTIYLKMRRGEFPLPKRLGPRSVGWIAAEVDAWLERLPRTGEASNGGAR
jgi:prophage regulatory protein